MKTLLFPLFTLLILASCTVDTVSQDELLQQELLSTSELSNGSYESGYYGDDDAYESSSSDASQNGQGFTETVLSNIQNYVNTNHSGQTIVKMEQETSYIEVDLSNGIEIYFDNNGNFMRYDD